jgi:hypothetical protein
MFRIAEKESSNRENAYPVAGSAAGWPQEALHSKEENYQKN